MLNDRWQKHILISCRFPHVFLFSVSAVLQTCPLRLPLHHLCCILLLQWITVVIAHTPNQTEPRQPFTAPFIDLLILTHGHMFKQPFSAVCGHSVFQRQASEDLEP